MKRCKMILLALAITIVATGFQGNIKTSYGQGITALATTSKIKLDDSQASLRTYNIGGHNYVKLRDIAWLLKGSFKQFDIAWDKQKNAINLLSNTPYSESKPIEESLINNAKCTISTASLHKDGQSVKMDAYIIGDRSYFKLQDVCQVLDIELDWDSHNKIVLINVSKTSEFKSGSYNNSNLSSFKNDVITLVNEKRVSEGLSKLSASNNLDEIAQFRAQDMYNDNYFSHNSPKYGTFGDLADTFGYREICMGENIAKGQITPEEVVEDWINSSGHRANILKDTYEDIGIGIVEYQPGKFIWVQVFSGTSR